MLPIEIWLARCGDVESNPGPTQTSLRILQINACSIKRVDYLKNKLVQFKTLVELKNPDVVSVAETWLNDTVLDKQIIDEDKYNLYRKDRSDANGGGILVAVKKNLNSRQRDDLESKSKFHNEMMIVEIKQTNGKCLGILSLYRPPKDLNFDFNTNLKHDLNSMWDKGLTEIIVTGDLNFSEIDWDTGYPPNINGLAYSVADTFQDFGLTQYNTNPSREDCDNILDVILVNHDENLESIEAYMDILDTDHFVLDYIYSVNCNLENTASKPIYDFRNTDFDVLSVELTLTNLDMFCKKMLLSVVTNGLTRLSAL